jgi:hypothetical protein
MAYGEINVYTHIFLTSVLFVGERPLSRSRFILGDPEN